MQAAAKSEADHMVGLAFTSSKKLKAISPRPWLPDNSGPFAVGNRGPQVGDGLGR